MKRALLGLVVIGSGLLAQSCVDDASAVYIAGPLAPDEMCVIAEDADFVALPSYDPNANTNYVMFLGVDSQLVNRQTDIAADPMGVHIEQADVTILAIDGSTLGIGTANPFRIPAFGYIPSSEDGMPSRGVVTLTLPQAIASAASGGPTGAFVVRVQLYGHTTGTLDIETEPYEFVVQVLNLCGEEVAGCLAGQDGNSWCGT